MTPLGCIAADACLFVLEEHGVFFSELRQELQVFNTPATFIWCCLEEGLGPSEAVAAYAETFGIDPAEAQRQVADMLHRWQGLGHVSGVEMEGASEIDLTTALGRLLANPALRRQHAESAVDVARALPLRASDMDAFLALDPAALEAEADLLRRRHLGMRDGSAAGDQAVPAALDRNAGLVELAARARARRGTPLTIAHCYSLLGTIVRIQLASAEAAAIVHPVLVHLEVREPGAVDAALDILEVESGWVLLEGIVPSGYCARLPDLAPLVKSAVRRIALNRHEYFLQIHAGVVSSGERCLILPAAAGSGKTTLTAALLRAGFAYFSDEYALLEQPDMRVRPVPLALTVKPGAAAVLASRYPELAQLAAHRREDEQTVRYLPPPQPLPPASRSLPVGWIVFPRYAPDAGTALRPIGRAEALQRLMRECLVLPEALERRGVEALVRWMREVACFELTMSDLDQAVRLVAQLCGTTGRDARG